MAVIKKAKKKDIVTVMASNVFNGKELAEMPTTDISTLVGKKLTLNLLEVIPDTNKYYTKISFRFVKTDGNKVFADFDGLELMRDYVSRMVIRRVRRIDNVQNLVTKDGVKLKIKMLATVSKKASSNVEKSVRNKISEMVSNFVKESTLEQLLDSIFSDDAKKGFVKELRNIYPLRSLEFRKVDAMA